MHRSRLFFLFLLAFGSIMLAACESTTIRMNYKPDAQPSLPSGAGLALYVETFTDARPAKSPEFVGDVHVTFFNVRTPATLEGGVVTVTTDAFRKAFRAAGFDVVEDVNSADLILRGRVNALGVRELISATSEYSEAEVEFDIAIFDRLTDKKLWFDVHRSGAKQLARLDATNLNESTLNKAFQEAVDSIVENADLRFAINEFAETRD